MPCVVYLTGYFLEHLDRQMSTGALFIDLKKASNLNTSEEAVWIDSWTVLPHELKECNMKWHALQSSHVSLESRARKNGPREGDTRGERERLPEMPITIFLPVSNYLAAAAWSVKSVEIKRLAWHKQNVPKCCIFIAELSRARRAAEHHG